ncbi:ribonucleotide reductase large subunit R1ii [Lentinus tigrinus ALCF2SS1-7]|uniref:Ribonucleoside-diphosphate reductase n=1 Tax=Lentinus tigrinus ALCF2SS1-6 TaxID=1328759 RepID=A0A5C2RUA6_9APHY|nr:ribonucleotide reductase large subunit R1ii [Lentinus tigrinus ALCF2SS1-6]RPD70541.1 ribonucleotide reductase large subunit R1ii [Lentinus tigrinus ALCF2SS1-7]
MVCERVVVDVRWLTSRFQLCWDLDRTALELGNLVNEISRGLTTQISAGDLLQHCAVVVASSATKHPDYSRLAGRISVVGLHKMTDKSFTNWVTTFGTGTFVKLGHIWIISDIIRLASLFNTDIDDAILHSRDFGFSYGAIQTLRRSYLLRAGGRVVERPQFLYMRVALAIHKDNLELVLQTYDALSRHVFTFATPTLVNAGTLKPHFASCFLYVPDASGPKGLLGSAHDMDLCWLADGGIGLTLGEVPCRRQQPGVLQLMRTYDSHAEYTSACRQTRPSAATVHLPIWHGDVRQFIQCRTSRAARHEQIVNLFPSLWICDLFMQRSEANEEWHLFDPVDVPALQDSFGEVFTARYIEYEKSVAPVATLRAGDLWTSISRAQEETGTPFVMFQDAINEKNNEAHLGVVRTSNLCTEIVQYASEDITAVCMLASIAAPRFVSSTGQYDFEGLHAVTKLAVLGVNALLDVARYPTEAAKASASNTRAVGVGVQGLADVFKACGLSFTCAKARELNIRIFETIYHASYEASVDLAAQSGPYIRFPGSPASMGRLQHDMWKGDFGSGRYDFARLRERIVEVGLRNSMLTAQMPTASTARLLGNFDGVEPYTSNILVHRVLSGDYTELCPWLVRDLVGRGLWTDEIRSMILKHHGSVQDIPSIPDDVKDVHRTVWEIDPMDIIDMAADRAPFVDQSQSMSLHVSKLSAEQMLRVQLHAWRRGLKTGVYYLRTQAPAYPLPYGVGKMVTDAAATGVNDVGKIGDNVNAINIATCENCSA